MKQYWKIIKTAADYQQALSRLDEVIDAEINTSEGDELELLALLIKDYEDRFYPTKMPDPIDMVKLRMEEMGLKNKDLIDIIGSESHVSSVLNRKRQITLEMARKLSKRLNIRASIFINDDHSFEDYEQDKALAHCQTPPSKYRYSGDVVNACLEDWYSKDFLMFFEQMSGHLGGPHWRDIVKEKLPMIISYGHQTSHQHIYILADMIVPALKAGHVNTEYLSDFFVRINAEETK